MSTASVRQYRSSSSTIRRLCGVLSQEYCIIFGAAVQSRTFVRCYFYTKGDDFMALMTCPECTGKVSDKAVICPHCGYPIQDKPLPVKAQKRGKRRRPNGSGTVVKLSGNRKKPYQVRVNTRLDDRGYPTFDILGTYEDKVQADISLAKYNENPYDVNLRNLTFTEVYERWYQRRFKRHPDEKVAKNQRSSSEYTARAAYKKCTPLHTQIYSTLRTKDMQDIADADSLSHSMSEHVVVLLRHLGRYALETDISQKDYASFVSVTKEEDDEHGIPFTRTDLEALWKNRTLPFVDTVLIYCYSGWRINELARMPLQDIDLQEKTFFGGMKTEAGRNRTVPIHSSIFNMVEKRYCLQFQSLIYHNGKRDIRESDYRKCFDNALKGCGIMQKHTPHDCRHTFNSMLDSAGVRKSTILKLMGHAGDLNEKIYTHKTIHELREAVESIWVP